MAESLTCPECQGSLRVKAIPPPGTKVQCFKCKQVFAVPGEKPKLKLKAPAPAAPQGDDLFGGASDGLFAADPFGGLGDAQPLGGGLSAGPAGSSAQRQAQPQYAQPAEEPTHPAVLWATIGGGAIGAIVLIGLMISSFRHMNRKEQPVVVAAPAAAAPAAKVTTPTNTVAAVPAAEVPVATVPAAGVPAMQYKWQHGTPFKYVSNATLQLPAGAGAPINVKAVSTFTTREFQSGESSRFNGAPNSGAVSIEYITDGESSNNPGQTTRQQSQAAISAQGELYFPHGKVNANDTATFISILIALPKNGERQWTVTRVRETQLQAPFTPAETTETTTYTYLRSEGNRHTIQRATKSQPILQQNVSISATGTGTIVFDSELGAVVEGSSSHEIVVEEQKRAAFSRNQRIVTKISENFRLESPVAPPANVVAAVPAATVPQSVAPTSSPMQYKWRKSMPLVYKGRKEAQIEGVQAHADLEITFTPKGPASADLSQFSGPPAPDATIVECRTATKPLGSNVQPSGVYVTAALSPHGQLHFRNTGWVKYATSFALPMILNRLPEGDQREWSVTYELDFEVVAELKRLPETTTYQLGERQGNRQTITLKTRLEKEIQPGLTLSSSGEGSFVFDIELGAVVEGSMDKQVSLHYNGTQIVTTESIDYRLEPPGSATNPQSPMSTVPSDPIPPLPGTAPSPSVPQPTQP